MFSEQIKKYLPNFILSEHFDAEDIESKYYFKFWCKYCEIHFLVKKELTEISLPGRDWLASPGIASFKCVVCDKFIETEY